MAALSATPVAARTQLRIVGSSTLYPFVTAVAEQFKRANPQFPGPIVESTGTGGGIKLFCSGIGERFPDVANASRRIKPGADCAKNGVTDIIEVQIGLDGLAVAQGRAGRFPGMTEEEIYRALAAMPYGRPQRARLWSDINPRLPRIRIEVLGPPPTSGTRDAFNELYMDKGCNANPAMKALKARDADRHAQICTAMREDGAYVEAGENDNLIVQKLAANPNLLGVFGYSYLEENLDKVKGVPISGVEPTYDNIATFAFPASRPLYVYVKAQHMRSVRGMQAFLTELSRESTWGRKGYLARRGLVASPDPVRAANAEAARKPVLLDPADVL
ncbi:substrate-binding domain-containing protein [Polymorphobacter sp.]|uniref:substrate-binding domain-containing protein n=1 Tax=Polymorphobacter sp. TaxID=1909290 RepID=UPI003F6ECD8C